MIKGLGERLQQQRILLKLSQKEVAVRIGTSPSVVSNYEVNKRVPSVEVLISLADLYHCSVDYLLGREKTIPLDVSMLNDKQRTYLQEFLDELK